MRDLFLFMADVLVGLLFMFSEIYRPMRNKLETMLVIQDELNQVIDKNWRDRNFRFEDAMMVEAVELFDHLPWKWWKKNIGAIDLEQAKLEAVDIWHFIQSRLLSDFTVDEAADILEEIFGDLPETGKKIVKEDLQNAVRSFLTDVSLENDDVITSDCEPLYLGSFVDLLEELGMTVDDLYVTFIAKTQLNRLRWANGYGSTYVKTWDGQEDNVWLAAYVKTLDVNALDFKEQVYAGLVEKYNEVASKVVLEAA